MKRKLFAVLVLAMVIGGGLYWRTGRPAVNRNNRALSQAVLQIHTDTVLLSEVVPFEWDAVYTPAPYASREEIEDMLGFSSPAIRANTISEGMTHLIFVRDQEVVCCVMGDPRSLGYHIWLDGDGVLTRDENVWFRVLREDGVLWLDSNVGEPEPIL